MSEQYSDGESNSKHGLEYILGRVKKGLTEATKSLMGVETAASVRDYLPVHDQDHRLVFGYVKSIQAKFQENPDLQPKGWEELWLPRAVEDQGWRVTRAQAERLIATLNFQSRQRFDGQDTSEEGVA